MKVEFKDKDTGIYFERLQEGDVFHYNGEYFNNEIYMKLPEVKNSSGCTYNSFCLTANVLSWFSGKELVRLFEEAKLIVE